MNQIFKKYKDIHKGEKAVLVAGGPSLEKFVPLEDVIYVGVNHIGKHRLFRQKYGSLIPGNIELDYYFFGDRDRYMSKDFKVVRQKFGSCIVDGEEHPAHLTKKEVESLGGEGFEQSNLCGRGNDFGLRFEPVPFQAYWMLPDHGFPDDISESPCYGHNACMPALQFLIYAGVSEIYLVGADCDGGPSFGVGGDSSGGLGPDFFGKERDYNEMLPDWNNFKIYLSKEKPNVKIISINPVGLKGYFEEIYY